MTLRAALLLVALVLFIVASVAGAPRVNLLALGLAALAAAWLVSG